MSGAISWGATVVLLVGAAGCETTADLAPLVGASLKLDPDVMVQLELGRRVYVTSCARCHNPEPVAAYTTTEWTSILPRMVEKTSLSDREAEALEAYVGCFSAR